MPTALAQPAGPVTAAVLVAAEPVVAALFLPPEATTYVELASTLSALITPEVEADWRSVDFDVQPAPSNASAILEVSSVSADGLAVLVSVTVSRDSGDNRRLLRFEADGASWRYAGVEG